MGVESAIADLRSADNFEVVTPSDATTYAGVRAVYVGGSGDLVVTRKGGGDVTFSGVQAGTLLPIGVAKVKAATTATAIVVLY
jgi:hypothetical protein